jgi:biotin carboxyl carrier protein
MKKDRFSEIEEEIALLAETADKMGLVELSIGKGKKFIKLLLEEKGIEPLEKARWAGDNYQKIFSPLEGMFYRSARPGDPYYVEIGSNITPDLTLALIEAMKVFNEIKSEITGRIVDILPMNGERVQKGDLLFVVEV